MTSTPTETVAGADLQWCCADTAGRETLDDSFGAMLKRLRQQAALSQQQLADKLGTTQSAIARLESGAAAPKLATLAKLAAALGQDLRVHVSGRPAS